MAPFGHTGVWNRSVGEATLEPALVVMLVVAGVLVAIGSVLLAAGGVVSGVVMLVAAGALAAAVYRAY